MKQKTVLYFLEFFSLLALIIIFLNDLPTLYYIEIAVIFVLFQGVLGIYIFKYQCDKSRIPERARAVFRNLMFSAQFSIVFPIIFAKQKYFGEIIVDFLNNIFLIPLFGERVIQPQNIYINHLGYLLIAGLIFGLIAFIQFQVVSRFGDKHILRKFQKILSYVSVIILFTAIYSSSFAFNDFGEKPQFFHGGTEEYISDRLKNELSFIDDLEAYGGFNHGYVNDSSHDNEFIVYLSQTGFWGSLLKLTQSMFQMDPDVFIQYSRISLAFLFSNVIYAIAALLKKNFGLIAAITFSFIPPFIFWILGPASYLIWFYFILFLPFLHALYRYPKVQEGSLSWKRYIFENFVIMGLVFLRSYVFLSNLMLSAAIPILYYELKENNHWKIILKRIVGIGVVGSIALLFVLVLHYIQLWLYLGSYIEAFSHLFMKTVERTDFTNTTTYWELFIHWMYDIKLFYFKNLPFGNNSFFVNLRENFTLGSMHLLYIVMFFLSSILKIIRTKIGNLEIKNQINNLFSMNLSVGLSMVASWSWFLNKGAMIPHSHMNGIMYMIPFGLCMFIFLGVFLQTIYEIVKIKIISQRV